MRERRARTGAGRWRWGVLLAATAAALTVTAAASAASAAVTGCAEVPAGHAITFSGGGFAPHAMVTAYVNGVLMGTTTADRRGEFTDVTVLVVSVPSDVRFEDTAGNTAVVTVTGCGATGGEGGGGGGEAPVTKDECKQDGYLEYAEPAFKNQGRCVTVASKSK